MNKIRLRERGILKCEPVEWFLSANIFLPGHFFTFRSSLSEMLHRSYSESIKGKF